MQTTQGAITNPLDLEIRNTRGYAPLHEVRDETHRDAIADDMRKRGWNGAPLVVRREFAISLTGVHRRAAAEAAGLDEIPGVDLEDIFDGCGLDMWKLINNSEEYSLETSYHDYSRLVCENLPEDVVEAYGLDMH